MLDKKIIIRENYKEVEDYLNKNYRHSLSPIQISILSKRIPDIDMIEGIINPKLSNLEHPEKIKDLRKAAVRLLEAIDKKEKIVFVVDYDQDGIGSGAIAKRAMIDFLGVPISTFEVIITDRISDGYGFSIGAAKNALIHNPDLVVTADQGSSDEEKIKFFLEESLKNGKEADLIVTDHHHIPDKTPPISAFAFVNPQRKDDISKDKALCGASVLFMLFAMIRVLLKERNDDRMKFDIRVLLDYAAPATIADCMDLKSESNRAIVKQGLNQMNRGERPAWRALKELGDSPIDIITEETIGFSMAPKVNAESRMGGNGLIALAYLTAQTDNEALEALQQMTGTNEERKAKQKILEQKAMIQAEELYKQKKKTFVIKIFDEDMVFGITGIVGSRIVDLYGRPTIILSKKPDGTIVGSGRSIDGFNIRGHVEITQEKRKTLLGFGGHPAAMGLSADSEENIEKFIEDLEEVSYNSLPSHEELVPFIRVDGPIPDGSNINSLSFYEEIQYLQPYGNGFLAPKFMHYARVVQAKPVGKNGKIHITLKLEINGEIVEAIWFFYKEKEEDDEPIFVGESYNFAFEVSRKTFNNRTSIQLKILNVKK